MRIPRTRGAVSGLVLVALGAWGVLVALIGPSFNLTIGSDSSWDLTTGRVLLEILPGAAVIVGGLILLWSANRATATLGGWLALAGGVWFVIGPTLSKLWTSGSALGGQAGAPAGSEGRQVVELLTMFYGLGAAIIAVSAFALGRLAVRSVRDVELAEEREVAPESRFERDRNDDAPTRVARDEDPRRDPGRDRAADETVVREPDDNARR
jgi:hypothetical protein